MCCGIDILILIPLFNDTLNNSALMLLKDRVNGELGRIWNEVVVA